MKVEARGVGKRFGERAALASLDFAVPSGRRVALVGPNGSGKSTLCRALAGLLRVEGDLRIDGLHPQRDRRQLAPRLAYVPQAPPPLAAPVGEVVRAVATLRGLPAGRLEETASRLDLPLARLASTPMRGLSGGMRQKLVIALALAGDAGLLLLDEPTGSLDPESRERFVALFDERAARGTVVLCSHRLEEILHLVDHVIELRDGHLLREGSATDFLAAAGRSVVELRAKGDAAVRWLAEQGFRRGRGDWWTRGVSRAGKVELTAAAIGALGGALEDLAVRDLGLREDPAAGADGPEGGAHGRG